jgi:hypothetical protein
VKMHRFLLKCEGQLFVGGRNTFLDTNSYKH